MTRRAFVHAALTAGLSLGAGCFSPSAGAKRPRVAAFLYSVRDQIAAVGLEPVLVELRQAGFEGVEFAGYGAKGVRTLPAVEIRRMLANAGLAVCGAHVGRGALTPERIRLTLEYARSCGNTYVVCAGGGMRPDASWSGSRADWWAKMADFFAQASETARAYGCRIGYHNHAWEFRERTHGTTVWEYLIAHTPEAVGIEQDAGWTLQAGEDPAQLYRAHPHRSPTVHLREVFAPGAPGIPGRPGTRPDGTPRLGVNWERLFAATDADGVAWHVVESDADASSTAGLRGGLWFLKSLERLG